MENTPVALLTFTADAYCAECGAHFDEAGIGADLEDGRFCWSCAPCEEDEITDYDPEGY